MNLPSSSVPRHKPWFRLVASAWLLALSAGLIVVMLDVLRLDTPPEPSPQASQVDALAARLGQAEQQLAAIKRQAPPLTLEARTELETRLTQVETALRGHADDQALQALQGRIEKLEARPAPTKVVIPPSRPKPASTKPAKEPLKVLLPPFQVMGVELRGGERFLTVAPLGAATVGQMRLLRAGEAEGIWTLENIGVKQATFRVEGKVQQLVVP
ncbi:hypothetical protein [Pseudomonas chlororaphis]|uniref:hypothetical protein n=1 Tax=Pseudomonas chlororaphis TaxID=587753 RepID=UPI0004706164|nr:hypothetical protein [Pseudomonas chlororaphis]